MVIVFLNSKNDISSENTIYNQLSSRSNQLIFIYIQLQALGCYRKSILYPRWWKYLSTVSSNTFISFFFVNFLSNFSYYCPTIFVIVLVIFFLTNPITGFQVTSFFFQFFEITIYCGEYNISTSTEFYVLLFTNVKLLLFVSYLL